MWGVEVHYAKIRIADFRTGKLAKSTYFFDEILVYSHFWSWQITDMFPGERSFGRNTSLAITISLQQALSGS